MTLYWKFVKVQSQHNKPDALQLSDKVCLKILQSQRVWDIWASNTQKQMMHTRWDDPTSTMGAIHIAEYLWPAGHSHYQPAYQTFVFRFGGRNVDEIATVNRQELQGTVDDSPCLLPFEVPGGARWCWCRTLSYNFNIDEFWGGF